MAMTRAWHPYDEAEAAGTKAAFIEWLRATRRLETADPAAIEAWPSRDPAGFATAIADFAGLDATLPPARNLFAPQGPREALVLYRPGIGRQSWSRDALRAGLPALPSDIAALLAGLGWAELVRIVAYHLLVAGTRPDDRLLWGGTVTDALPYGALLLGATVILVDDPSADRSALGTAERARLLRPPPAPEPG
jgi:acetoacetyl-CoA synthetase